MLPKEKTLAAETETLGNQTEWDAVMARLASVQNYLTNILDNQADDDKRLDMFAKQLDHLDGMTHEVHQFITENKAALAKGLALLDPGQSVRKYWKTRKGADPDDS
jgi:ABC-type transporter Mla subunit MlaD